MESHHAHAVTSAGQGAAIPRIGGHYGQAIVGPRGGILRSPSAAIADRDRHSDDVTVSTGPTASAGHASRNAALLSQAQANTVTVAHESALAREEPRMNAQMTVGLSDWSPSRRQNRDGASVHQGNHDITDDTADQTVTLGNVAGLPVVTGAAGAAGAVGTRGSSDIAPLAPLRGFGGMLAGGPGSQAETFRQGRFAASRMSRAASTELVGPAVVGFNSAVSGSRTSADAPVITTSGIGAAAAAGAGGRTARTGSAALALALAGAGGARAGKRHSAPQVTTFKRLISRSAALDMLLGGSAQDDTSVMGQHSSAAASHGHHGVPMMRGASSTATARGLPPLEKQGSLSARLGDALPNQIPGSSVPSLQVSMPGALPSSRRHSIGSARELALAASATARRTVLGAAGGLQGGAGAAIGAGVLQGAAPTGIWMGSDAGTGSFRLSPGVSPAAFARGPSMRSMRSRTSVNETGEHLGSSSTGLGPPVGSSHQPHHDDIGDVRPASASMPVATGTAGGSGATNDMVIGVLSARETTESVSAASFAAVAMHLGPQESRRGSGFGECDSPRSVASATGLPDLRRPLQLPPLASRGSQAGAGGSRWPPRAARQDSGPGPGYGNGGGAATPVTSVSGRSGPAGGTWAQPAGVADLHVAGPSGATLTALAPICERSAQGSCPDPGSPDSEAEPPTDRPVDDIPPSDVHCHDARSSRLGALASPGRGAGGLPSVRLPKLAIQVPEPVTVPASMTLASNGGAASLAVPGSDTATLSGGSGLMPAGQAAPPGAQSAAQAAPQAAEVPANSWPGARAAADAAFAAAVNTLIRLHISCLPGGRLHGFLLRHPALSLITPIMAGSNTRHAAAPTGTPSSSAPSSSATSRAIAGYSVGTASLHEFKMGIGLHCGPAIEGAIGSRHRLEATYLSGAVNAAARIESATRFYGVDLLISDSFASCLSPGVQALLRRVDRVQLKGVKAPATLFCFDWDRDAARRMVATRFGPGAGLAVASAAAHRDMAVVGTGASTFYGATPASGSRHVAAAGGSNFYGSTAMTVRAPSPAAAASQPQMLGPLRLSGVEETTLAVAEPRSSLSSSLAAAAGLVRSPTLSRQGTKGAPTPLLGALTGVGIPQIARSASKGSSLSPASGPLSPAYAASGPGASVSGSAPRWGAAGRRSGAEVAVGGGNGSSLNYAPQPLPQAPAASMLQTAGVPGPQMQHMASRFRSRGPWHDTADTGDSGSMDSMGGEGDHHDDGMGAAITMPQATAVPISGSHGFQEHTELAMASNVTDSQLPPQADDQSDALPAIAEESEGQGSMLALRVPQAGSPGPLAGSQTGSGSAIVNAVPPPVLTTVNCPHGPLPYRSATAVAAAYLTQLALARAAAAADAGMGQGVGAGAGAGAGAGTGARTWRDGSGPTSDAPAASGQVSPAPASAAVSPAYGLPPGLALQPRHAPMSMSRAFASRRMDSVGIGGAGSLLYDFLPSAAQQPQAMRIGDAGYNGGGNAFPGSPLSIASPTGTTSMRSWGAHAQTQVQVQAQQAGRSPLSAAGTAQAGMGRSQSVAGARPFLLAQAGAAPEATLQPGITVTGSGVGVGGMRPVEFGGSPTAAGAADAPVSDMPGICDRRPHILALAAAADPLVADLLALQPASAFPASFFEDSAAATAAFLGGERGAGADWLRARRHAERALSVRPGDGPMTALISNMDAAGVGPHKAAPSSWPGYRTQSGK